MRSATNRYAVAFGSLLGLAAVVWVAIVSPLLRHHMALDGEISTHQFNIARLRATQDSEHAVDRLAVSLTTRTQSEDGYLASDKTSLAGAELQRYVQQRVDDNKGVLLSSQVLPPKPEQELTRFAIKAHVRASLSELQQIVYELEMHNPTAFLDDVTITKVPDRALRNSNDNLDTWMTINAYAKIHTN